MIIDSVSTRSTLPLRQLLTTVLLALGVVAGGLLTAPAAQAAAAEEYAAAAHRWTNHHRAQHGLTRLRTDACLQRYAARQATRMARQRRMFHQSLGVVLDGCGLALVAENVAVGYPTGRAVVNRGWMRSPGHRANILAAGHRVEAIAARRGGDGRWYVAQVLGRRL